MVCSSCICDVTRAESGRQRDGGKDDDFAGSGSDSWTVCWRIIRSGFSPISLMNLILHGLIGGKNYHSDFFRTGRRKSHLSRKFALARTQPVGKWSDGYESTSFHSSLPTRKSRLFREWVITSAENARWINLFILPLYPLYLLSVPDKIKTTALCSSVSLSWKKRSGHFSRLWRHSNSGHSGNSQMRSTRFALMKLSDLNLYVVRRSILSSHLLTYAEMLKQDYHIENMHMVLKWSAQSDQFQREI